MHSEIERDLCTVLEFEMAIFLLALMFGVAFLYGATLRSSRLPLPSALVLGVIFATGVNFAILAPNLLISASNLDISGLLVGLAIVFAGWVPGAMAFIAGLVSLHYLGSSNVWVGSLGLGIAFGVGAIWRLFGSRLHISESWKDVGLGITVAMPSVLVLLLPFGQVRSALVGSGPAMLLAHVIGAVILGAVFRYEIRNVQDAEKLRHFAEVDPLTNLLNRRGAARARLKLPKDVGRGQALLYFDVDFFKTINDRYGHVAGDIALAAIAARIQAVVRDDVIFSRHGGDEFTVYLRDVDEATVEKVADRMLHCVNSAPIGLRDGPIRASISIGAFWTTSRDGFEDLLEQADVALLQAKALGRNQASLGWRTLDMPLQVSQWETAGKALH